MAGNITKQELTLSLANHFDDKSNPHNVTATQAGAEKKVERSTNPPNDTTKLWIDENSNLIKYHNGSQWIDLGGFNVSENEPSNPNNNSFWLDTSVTPNPLKRYDGTGWVKVTPTSPGDIGAASVTHTHDGRYVNTDGDTMTGELTVDNYAKISAPEGIYTGNDASIMAEQGSQFTELRVTDSSSDGGILVRKSSDSGSSWNKLFEAGESSFTYKGHDIWHEGNLTPSDYVKKGEQIDFGTSSGTIGFIREASSGQIEIGSDNYIDFIETDEGTTSVSISTNNGSVDATGGFRWSGQSLDDRYLRKGAKANDSDNLDGHSSGSFLRSNTSDTFTGGTLQINGTLKFGGGGEWGMKANGEDFVLLETDDGSKEYIRIKDGSRMEFKPNGVERFVIEDYRSTVNRLRITSSADANAGDDDAPLTIGPHSSQNLKLDRNEVSAYNNGGTGVLYLNNDGGDVRVDGHTVYHTGNIRYGTGNPSGGSNGDIYIKY